MSKGLIFTFLLTYGGATVSLFNPYVGLLIYVCFAIVRPDHMWHWSVPIGNYSRFVALALLMGWATQAFGKWRLDSGEQRLLPGIAGMLTQTLLNGVALLIGWPLKAFGRGQIVMTLLLHFWLWGVVSSFFAEDTDVAWDYVESVAKIVLIFLVGLSCIDSVSKLKQLAWVIVLSQGYVAYELNLNYFAGLNANFIQEGFGGMDNNCSAIALVTCIGLAFFLGLHAGRWWLTLIAFGIAVLMAHALMFSFSRGGLLALSVVGVVSFMMIPKKPIYYVVIAIAGLLAFQLAGAEVRQRFFTAFASAKTRDASADSRLVMWANCLDVMEKHPLVGVGPDHWPLISHHYGWRKGKEAHTLWLQIGAELGVPGLMLLLAFYGVVCFQVWRMCRRTDLPDPWLGHVARMVIPSLVGFMVSAQFVSLKGLEVPYYVALLGAGGLKLSALLVRPGVSPSEDETPSPFPT